MPESPLVSVRLDPEVASLIEEVQHELNLSRSEVLRVALTAGLKDTKAMSRQLKNPLIRQLVRLLYAIEGDPDQMEFFERAVSDPGTVPGVPPGINTA